MVEHFLEDRESRRSVRRARCALAYDTATWGEVHKNRHFRGEVYRVRRQDRDYTNFSEERNYQSRIFRLYSCHNNSTFTFSQSVMINGFQSDLQEVRKDMTHHFLTKTSLAPNLQSRRRRQGQLQRLQSRRTRHPVQASHRARV